MDSRIKLEKGKQRLLIDCIKKKLNLTWKKLSEQIDCNEDYLRSDLRTEKLILPKRIYKNLCKLGKINFDKFIIAELKSNWGQIKGGKSVKFRKNLFKEIKLRLLCKPSRAFAEIMGILIGDGSVYILPEKSIYQVHVAGHLIEDRTYLLNYVKPLFEKTFNIDMNIKETKTGLYVWKQSKNLVFTLNHYGLPSGNKKQNNITIPSWIIQNKLFLKYCLRGIFDTDGCVYPKNKTHLYPTLWFSSAIPNLRSSLTECCTILGFYLSKWNGKIAYIGRKNDILKFYKEVNFKNKKHRMRWSRFNKLP